MENISPEFNSAHGVKALLCFLLNRLNRAVTEEQLYEIVLESEVVNYFFYAEALEALLKNRSLRKTERDGKVYIELEEKGRQGADYFNDTIPYYFRKQLLKAAMYYFARLDRESSTDMEIVSTKNGFEVRCAVKDVNFDVMRLSLYAPDGEQAKLIRDKIMLDPNGFYRKIIGYALENEEEVLEINAN
ncbi:MAG: DUF4364 family protein [Ruminococcus sp.]|nr:DUF4364 family protein [Ruminococcus sp.]MCM1478927.1 DUF4364 family protein [Muribaculaceae bacterium]